MNKDATIDHVKAATLRVAEAEASYRDATRELKKAHQRMTEAWAELTQVQDASGREPMNPETCSIELLREAVADAARMHGSQCAQLGYIPSDPLSDSGIAWKRFRRLLAALAKRAT